MVAAVLGCLVVLATAQGASASSDPYADGQTIRWSGDGWWQVQDTENYNEICAGSIDALNSCDVGRPGTFKVTNHSTGQRWNVEVTSTRPARPLAPPNLRLVEYEQAGYVSVIWQSLRGVADGVNIYRDGNYETTVRTGTVWNDFEGRPGSVYYAIAFRDDQYSERSRQLTARVDQSDWYPERDYSAAEDRIRGRLYGRHLSESTKEQIILAAGSAFGERGDLISKWHRDAGGEIRPYEAGGLVRCRTAFHDTRIYLPDRTSNFTIVHELAHVIDCSRSGSSSGAGKVDGIGAGMTGADQANFVAERSRLVQLNNSGNRPAWLRPYTFSSNGEFFADVSAYFLTSQRQRTQMALGAPLLYETLRSYYGKDHWTAARDIAWQSDPTLSRG